MRTTTMTKVFMTDACQMNWLVICPIEAAEELQRIEDDPNTYINWYNFLDSEDNLYLETEDGEMEYTVAVDPVSCIATLFD